MRPRTETRKAIKAGVSEHRRSVPLPGWVARLAGWSRLAYRSESEKAEGFVHLHTSMSSPATRWDSVWIRDSLEARNSTARSHTRFMRRLQ